jgi:lipoprotein-releasing system permease protein
MNLPYQVFIALRYLKSKKRHRSLSFNTAISIGGVAVGVMALLVVLSVMSGFHEDLQRKILGVTAHVVVLSYTGPLEDYPSVLERVREEPRVRDASPFVLGQAMISSEGKAQGVFVRGIDPSLEMKTTRLEDYMKEGALKDLEREKEGLPGIVLGRELAGRLGASVGDTVRIISPTGAVGPLGLVPRVKQFEVAGIFEVGMYEYDSNLVLVGMGPAQEFFALGDAVTGIELRIDDIYKAKEVSQDLQKKLGFPLYARDWIQMNKNLFAALRLEKFTMFIILTLIVLVAAFNIISTLIMNVIEKEREIAILKAMGATNRGIMSVFMLQGFLIGLVGTVIGITGGWLLGYLMNTYEIVKLPADVYYLSHLPVKMKLVDFLVVSSSAVVISFLATIYPAWQASRLNPIEPLRYE